jgi:hypothetical protein
MDYDAESLFVVSPNLTPTSVNQLRFVAPRSISNAKLALDPSHHVLSSHLEDMGLAFRMGDDEGNDTSLTVSPGSSQALVARQLNRFFLTFGAGFPRRW